MTISKAAQELGRKGGQAKSPAKTAAARANAKKPRGKWVTAVAYRVKSDGKFYQGVAVRRGDLKEDQILDLVYERMTLLHEVTEYEIAFIGAETIKV